MNKTRKMLLAMACVFASLTLSAQTTQHTISNGETIYAIARKYNITVNQLLAANPGIGDGNRILVGQQLTIPTSSAPAQQVTTTTTPTPTQHVVVQNKATTTTTEQNPRKGYLNSGIKEMYRVKKKDNLYRIALLYNLTIEELIEANPPLTPTSKVKKDELLCIPFSKAEKEADRRKAEQAAAEKAAAEARLASEAANLRKHIKVGVLLPFKDGNDRATKMIEFYRGILMAADSVKQEGTTVEVHAFHTGSSASDMHFITNKASLKQMNIIFGPLDAAQAAPLSEFCRQNKIRLVMPFATTNTFGLSNPYVYQATSTGDTSSRLGAQRMLKQFTNNTFTILKSDAPDNRGIRFTNEMSAELTRKGFPPRTITLKESDEALAATLNQFRSNVIMTDATSLAAATAVCKRLTSFLQNHPEFRITLIGFPEWVTYNQTLSSNFHTLDTYVFTNFYRNPSDRRVQNFETNYANNFQQVMIRTFPRYGLMGFDMAYYFLHGMAQWGELFDTKQGSANYNPLQNAFSFTQQNEGSAHTNEALWLIHYTSNRQVEIIK